MNGAAVASAGGLGSVPAPWSIVQTGDCDGDGKSTSIWFMNGFGVSSTAERCRSRVRGMKTERPTYHAIGSRSPCFRSVIRPDKVSG